MKFQEELILPPHILSKNLKSLIRAKLIQKVQGSVTEKYGYLICVIKIGEIPNGIILDTSGDILFTVDYRAVVMKPFVGEVCDGVVDSVDEYGILAAVGPIKVYISNADFPPDFEYSANNKYYISSKADKIDNNSQIRFRIKAVQFDGAEFKPTGTMAEDYLGPL